MADGTDYSLLIPELPDWNNGDGISVDGWLGCMGNFELAIAFSRLFWPRFVEHDGCVLYESFSTSTYHAFFASCKGDRAAVEAVMNHRHILDYFCHARPTATASQMVYLGKVLKEILVVKLAHDFAGRSFEIHFDEGPHDDLVDYQLTFWQPSNVPPE